jgi:AraC-like DNA-binding protein
MIKISKNLSEIDLPVIREVVFGSVVYEPGGSFGPRRQRDLQLVMLDRGSVQIETDGLTRTLRCGEVVCQWPGGEEHFRFDDRVESAHRWLTLRFASEDPSLAHLREQLGPSSAVARETERMRQIFELGWTGGPASDSGVGVELARAYLTAFSGQLRLGGETAAAGSVLPGPLRLMRETIETRYAEPLILDDLARSGNVTASHLVRLCRQRLATTPMRLLWDTRAQRGIDLLRSTGLGVAEIAYRVGYASPFHFSRAVRERLGHPPTEERRRAWRAREL